MVTARRPLICLNCRPPASSPLKVAAIGEKVRSASNTRSCGIWIVRSVPAETAISEGITATFSTETPGTRLVNSATLVPAPSVRLKGVKPVVPASLTAMVSPYCQENSPVVETAERVCGATVARRTTFSPSSVTLAGAKDSRAQPITTVRAAAKMIANFFMTRPS